MKPTAINEWDDAASMPAPCRPIGCDAGFHLKGCVFGLECNNCAPLVAGASMTRVDGIEGDTACRECA